MHISIDDDNSLTLYRLHPVQAQALCEIPKHADPADVPEAEKRLYPDLLSPGEIDATGTAEEDWAEFVIPELKEEFSQAIRTVIGDLANLTRQPDDDEIDEDDEDEDDEDDEQAETEEVDSLIQQTKARSRDSKKSGPKEASEIDLMRLFAKRPLFYQITIPRENLEHWLSAMNQARLVMTEKDLWVEDNGNLHGPVMAQIHYEIYTHLQEFIVHLLTEEI